MSTKHVMRRIDGGYDYRGVTIYRNPFVRTGQFGKWSAVTDDNISYRGVSLKVMRATVDAYLNKQG